VFAFPDMMDFFPHELSRLGVGRFSLLLVPLRSPDGLFFRHDPFLLLTNAQKSREAGATTG
jgi:hypothetical protein